MDTLPIAEVKAQLSALADRVEKQHDLITVTRNGRPSFHMISADELEGLRETVAILSDHDVVQSLQRAVEEGAGGRGVALSYDEARALLLGDVSD